MIGLCAATSAREFRRGCCRRFGFLGRESRWSPFSLGRGRGHTKWRKSKSYKWIITWILPNLSKIENPEGKIENFFLFPPLFLNNKERPFPHRLCDGELHPQLNKKLFVWFGSAGTGTSLAAYQSLNFRVQAIPIKSALICWFQGRKLMTSYEKKMLWFQYRSFAEAQGGRHRLRHPKWLHSLGWSRTSSLIYNIIRSIIGNSRRSGLSFAGFLRPWRCSPSSHYFSLSKFFNPSLCFWSRHLQRNHVLHLHHDYQQKTSRTKLDYWARIYHLPSHQF